MDRKERLILYVTRWTSMSQQKEVRFYMAQVLTCRGVSKTTWSRKKDMPLLVSVLQMAGQHGRATLVLLPPMVRLPWRLEDFNRDETTYSGDTRHPSRTGRAEECCYLWTPWWGRYLWWGIPCHPIELQVYAELNNGRPRQSHKTIGQHIPGPSVTPQLGFIILLHNILVNIAIIF